MSPKSDGCFEGGRFGPQFVVWCAKTCFHCFWASNSKRGGEFHEGFRVHIAKRGGNLRRRCARGSCFWASGQGNAKKNNRSFSRGIGPNFARAAARILRPHSARAETQIRRAGGNLLVSLDESSGFQASNLLLAVSTEAAVKAQNGGWLGALGSLAGAGVSASCVVPEWAAGRWNRSPGQVVNLGVHWRLSYRLSHGQGAFAAIPIFAWAVAQRQARHLQKSGAGELTRRPAGKQKSRRISPAAFGGTVWDRVNQIVRVGRFAAGRQAPFSRPSSPANARC